MSDDLPRWKDSPVVFVRIPTCPRCGSASKIIVRSQTYEWGTIERKCICRECSSRYRIQADAVDFDD